MMHLHFGTGRLGLGLVAPFFQTPGSQLHLLNRATSGTNATGATALSPERRNRLLQSHPEQHSRRATAPLTSRRSATLASTIKPMAEQAAEERSTAS